MLYSLWSKSNDKPEHNQNKQHSNKNNFDQKHQHNQQEPNYMAYSKKQNHQLIKIINTTKSYNKGKRNRADPIDLGRMRYVIMLLGCFDFLLFWLSGLGHKALVKA